MNYQIFRETFFYIEIVLSAMKDLCSLANTYPSWLLTEGYLLETSSCLQTRDADRMHIESS
jgi:hypothetical protein